LKIIMLAAVTLFIVGAVAETRHTHTVWGQDAFFWLLLGLGCWTLEYAVGDKYAKRLHR
jgi:hypothetical protein